MSLFNALSKRVGTAIWRAGSNVTIRRRGGGSLTVPEDETFTIESGETARFESVDTSADGAQLIVNGNLVVKSEEDIENIYGNTTDESAGVALLGTYRARRMYIGEDDLPDFARESGGARTSDSPVIVFQTGTVAERGDRVEFPDGLTYELQSELERDTHTEFRANRITS